MDVHTKASYTSTGTEKDSSGKEPEIQNCVVRKRVNPQRRKDKVYVGCGAGFGGDRPLAALKLLQRVNELNYLVLECLAERTLSDRYKAMKSGGVGFDPRIQEWMHLLLPLAVERGVCIITNMGANDTCAAQQKVLETASTLGISITVGVAYQVEVSEAGLDHHTGSFNDGISVYLGAAPIVECLEKHRPNVIITSRVADAALFLAPMVYELGWNWDDVQLLAQGSLAGHLLECGCQLTGGYFMHPGDKFRDIPFSQLLDLSLPFTEVGCDGKVCVGKADGSGGVLNFSTCAQQLLYEVGDPGAYITPDVVIDFRDVSFQSLTKDKVICSGAKPAAALVPDKLLLLAPKVRSWLEETYPGVGNHIISYIIGLDSLKTSGSIDRHSLEMASADIRLRMDGLFEQEDHAIQFTKDFLALYTNGPAGGGGISIGHRKESFLEKALVSREHVKWKISAESMSMNPNDQRPGRQDFKQVHAAQKSVSASIQKESIYQYGEQLRSPEFLSSPAPSGQPTPLYNVAHSRVGDKGNDLNFSIIPHFPPDIDRLKKIITLNWVKEAISALVNFSSFPTTNDIESRNKLVNEHLTVEIYEVRGIKSLNVVVREILDGGVNCSRRIDGHGKTISDLILSQVVVLPPYDNASGYN
ncbi:uncharacterized protein LOC141689460 isoform X2 [Apium graveolens]|uniref:uncharacterized protein LOC141689460 isoform X2 n=1 Tax=Apium graveolens TaxID=4045 RepID=UPI003D78FF48